MVPFCILLVILLLGFVGGFGFTAPTLFPNFVRSSLNVYTLMLGDFDIADFISAGPAAVVMFAVFMFIEVIVLLNLLIAIMGASYEKASESEEFEKLKLRAEVLEDIDNMYL